MLLRFSVKEMKVVVILFVIFLFSSSRCYRNMAQLLAVGEESSTASAAYNLSDEAAEVFECPILATKPGVLKIKI